ncbi:MAG: SbcC/MukB-like Walker B domain-containing protein [Verrucomicrobiota bacterium]
MSRAIKLTRIHAINWYGYNDTLAIDGNLLLAGVTGSGKSILMDLIMTVLVGTDVAHDHFNRSATGRHSKRTLKGYCLLDTKREENGVPEYQRNKGAITYIALEFTWPAKTGENPRVETWGLRIEFRNTAENQGHIDSYYCDGQLCRDDFLAVSAEDGKKRPLELAAFRNFIVKERDGRIFETQKQYLRDMANEQHLNYNPAVLTGLLPQAMAFTNRESFDSFIRDYVLPGDQLDVENVVASYKSFLSFEADLKELRDQKTRLEAINKHFVAYTNAKRDQVVARWLAADLTHQNALAVMRDKEAELQREQNAYAEEEKKTKALGERIETRKSDIEQLKNLIRTIPGGETYLFIKERNKTLVGEIEGLRAVGTRVDEALRNRVRKARQWRDDALNAPIAEKVNVAALDSAIKHLEGCDANDSEVALKAVADAAESVKAALNRAIAPTRKTLDDVRPKLGKLREEIDALKLGHLPFPTLLLEALNRALPREGRQPAALPLCKLCELTDEKWRAAAEVAFTRKFAVVVSEANYEQAIKIYHELKSDSPQESLVHPGKALRLTKPAKPGSLAEKIRAEHPVARAVVNQLFGDLICVEKREDLAKHDYAILPDGFMTRGAFVERRRHYDNFPFIGQKGLDQQLALKESQWKDLDTQERRLAPVVNAVQGLIERAEQYIPEHTSLTADLVRAQGLSKLQQELDGNIAKLKTIDRATFEEKERELEKLGKDLPAWEDEHLKLLGSQQKGKVEGLEKALKIAKGIEEAALKAFDRVKEESGDISVHAKRLNDWRAEVTTQFPALDVAAQEFHEAENSAKVAVGENWAHLVAARRELGLLHRKFRDDPAPESTTNEPWDVFLSQIEKAKIPEYEEKSKIERTRWENLFRNNVLQRIDQALRRLRDVIVLLNDYLKTPIGNDLYEIQPKPNPDFKHLRDLVSLNAQHQRDELFYAAVDGQMRATLDGFLLTLVEKENSPEAARLLDYRHYYDYDLLVRDKRDESSKPISVDKQSGKMSGGENQSPYFVVILASYLRAYKRHESRWRDPSLALVPIDEAFSKMDTGRIKDCIEAIKELDLQGVFSMSTGNVPGAFGLCEQLIIVSRNEEKRAGRPHVRNVPVSILRDSEEGQRWMQEHS